MVGRALLVIAIASAALHHAAAQFGNMPGLPGETPSAPTEQCRQLLVLRDKLDKHGAEITAATKGKSDVKTACQVLRAYVATEATMLKALDNHGAQCGVPAQVGQQVKENHGRATEIAQQVCDAANRPPGRDDPSIPPFLDDRLLPLKPMPGLSRGPGG